MLTSRCGNICVMPPKCLCNEIRCGFSVCVCEGNRVTSQRSLQPIWNSLNRGLCTANTYEHHHATLFPFQAWNDGKANLKVEVRDYGKGRYISNACLWCSANHNALGQLANRSKLCLSEGGALKKMTLLRESGHRAMGCWIGVAARAWAIKKLPVGGKQWLSNIFDAWIIQEICSRTLDKTTLHNFF